MEKSAWEEAGTAFKGIIHSQAKRAFSPNPGKRCRNACRRKRLLFGVLNASARPPPRKHRSSTLLRSAVLLQGPADPSYVLQGCRETAVLNSLLNSQPHSEEHLYNESLWSCYHRLNMLRLLLTGCFWAVSYTCRMWKQFAAVSAHLLHVRGWAALDLSVCDLRAQSGVWRQTQSSWCICSTPVPRPSLETTVDSFACCYQP